MRYSFPDGARGGHMAEVARGLSDEIKKLVRGANFGHLATLLRDGTPHVDPVWIDLEGESILVCTGASSLKAKNTRRDARVGLSVVAMDNPYEEAQFRGRVVEQRTDRDFQVMDRISHKYTGKPFPWRDSPAERRVLVIAVEHARHTALPFVHSPGL
jgi:PPOX class probable F420-dependent enzyme